MIADELADLAVDIDSLSPLPGNPRVGDVEAIARSLDRFGQRRPIVVRKSDRTITAGNHTWRAARSLGWTHIAAVVLDDDASTAHAYALADNRTGDLGRYDNELLLALLQAVEPLDLPATGYTAQQRDDLASLLASLDEVPVVEPTDERNRLDQLAAQECPFCHAHWRIGLGGTVEPLD